MPDAGEVKAKVIIEYDGSGIKQAKEDLASLAESAGSVGQSAEKASDGLSGLDGQLSSNAESARGFFNVLADLPKMTEAGGAGVAEMTSALVEHKSAVEEAGTAYESLQKPVGTTVSMLQEASAPMQTISKNAESMQAQVSMAGESFTQVGESLSQSIPMLPQFAESMHAVSESFDPKAFGLDDFVRNTEVFQEALSSPTPFSMMKEHILETGQTWSDFTSSLSGSDAAMFTEMVQRTSGSYPVLDKAAESAQKVGTAFTEAANGANEFTAQYNGMNDAVVEANKSMGETGAILEETGKASKGGLFSGFLDSEVSMGGIGGGILNALNDVAMPLMAVQMIAQTVGMVGQSIYDSAAIAEGPAAHGFGTFTGAIDTFSASASKGWQSFSEGFGQGLMPMLDAVNNVTAQNGGGGGFLAGAGKLIGTNLGVLGDLGQMVGGGLIGGLAKIVTLNPGNTFGNDWMQAGSQGLANTWANLTGAPEPFPGPMPPNVNPAQAQIDAYYAQANNPQLLASQAAASSAYGKAVQNQQSWDVSHYGGSSGPMDPMNDFMQMQAVTAAGGAYGNLTDPNAQFFGWNDYINGKNGPAPGSYNGLNYSNSGGNSGGGATTGSGGGGGMGGMFGGFNDWFKGAFGEGGSGGSVGAWFNSLFSGDGGASVPATTFTGGCFVAGTPISLANGTTRSIEALQVGDKVLAYDGINEVVTTVLARIKPLPKRVYKLAFDDGRTLTLTNAHPLAGVDGWKSLSPDATAQENPGLEVSILAVGDVIRAVNGEVKLTSILPLQGLRQIYNIEVGDPHTFYAAGILVHNKMASSGGSMTNGGVGSEQVSLSHTFTANVQWEANNLQKQFTGAASWVGQGLANTFQGAASWVAQGLSNTFQGAAAWVAQGLSNTFQGAAAWVAQGLQNTFQGAASWIGQGLENTFQGAAKWVGSGLENTFQGAAKWAGSGLEHTFNAVANWTSQNLTPNFTVNPSFTMLAEGTSNWGGGAAIVGEAGPEVVESNGRYSMFDAGASLVNLPPGSNVYPMKNLGSAGVTQFADGTSGQVIPLNIGLRGGGMPESISLTIQIGENDILSAVKMPFAQDMRVVSGNRSY